MFVGLIVFGGGNTRVGACSGVAVVLVVVLFIPFFCYFLGIHEVLSGMYF